MTTMAAINAALTGANGNGGYFQVSPIPGNTGFIDFTYSVTDSTAQPFANAGRVHLVVTQRLAGIGLHDDVSLDFVFSPNWLPLR